MRRWLTQNPWIKPMSVFNYAALLIQKLIRGFLAKRFVKRKRRGGKAANMMASSSRKKRGTGKQLERYMKMLEVVKTRANKPAWLSGGFSSWCAVRIQSLMRMYPKRKRYLQRKRLVNQVASIIIQTCWRNVMIQRKNPYIPPPPVKAPLSRNNAARRIQLLWRSYCNRRIYKYFRDLVLFKLKGAPVELLRTIIPNESSLLDRASGIHVKFRLGGWIFPPKVYFKIFTHRPLCDVNAFAPRDYTKENNIKQDPLAINNHQITNGLTKKRVIRTSGLRVGVRYFDTIVSSTNIQDGSKEWYRREDNNDWRPISSHKFESISSLTPPWFREVNHSQQPKPFHYHRQYRQQDLIAIRKKKKREWMIKLYHMNGIDITTTSNNTTNIGTNSDTTTISPEQPYDDDIHDNTYYHNNNNYDEKEDRESSSREKKRDLTRSSKSGPVGVVLPPIPSSGRSASHTAMTMMMMASSAQQQQQQQQYHHPPLVAEPKTSKLAMLPTSNTNNVNGNNAGSSVRQPYKHTTGSTREVSESDLIKWR